MKKPTLTDPCPRIGGCLKKLNKDEDYFCICDSFDKRITFLDLEFHYNHYNESDPSSNFKNVKITSQDRRTQVVIPIGAILFFCGQYLKEQKMAKIERQNGWEFLKEITEK